VGEVRSAEDREVHDLRVVEIMYALGTSILILSAPVDVVLVLRRVCGVSVTDGWWSLAQILSGLMIPLMVLRTLRILRSFESAVGDRSDVGNSDQATN
jgi:hypothetical protein